MKTKLIPALVSLLACAVVCVNSLLGGFSFGVFAHHFVIAAIVFYIIGLIVKSIIDKGYDAMSDSLSGMEDYEMDEDLIDEELNGISEEEYNDFEDISK